MENVNRSPYFQMADVNLKFTKPETQIVMIGIRLQFGSEHTRYSQTLQYALRAQRMGYFYMNGKQYSDFGRNQSSAA
jgi:multidrug efflux pump